MGSEPIMIFGSLNKQKIIILGEAGTHASVPLEMFRVVSLYITVVHITLPKPTDYLTYQMSTCMSLTLFPHLFDSDVLSCYKNFTEAIKTNGKTGEAILTLRLILEERLRKGKPTFLAFVDLEKAFDIVDWNTLFQILKVPGVKYRERKAIYNLYRNQMAVIRVEGHEREAVVGKGVRQGIKIHGEEIKTLRFADDIVILSETAKDLEEQLNGMDSVLKGGYKMNINKSKTRIMECSQIKSGDAEGIRLGNETLKVVKEFCYLGSKITDDGRSREDIKCRLAMARKAFLKKRNLLTSNIDLGVRKSFLKVFVWSVAMYGSETWTITSLDKKRIEAFEMWCYRRMLKIRWVDHVTNEELTFSDDLCNKFALMHLKYGKWSH
ncbi:uncharacterized protein LOC126191016 [Schistocerca cancellata]|uniref:uncharacterized protein LOC126191016 n=1 Tax=Schistocerca cancellata TaxID=274614 RepID=UPI0021191361|nr:uncharacterized protein LOC126191016 [Schistocerca cancellata]